MKNLSFILTAFASLSTLVASAQYSSRVADSDGRSVTARKEKSQPATGSMFINDKFLPAKISGAQSTVLLRYNAYADNFEMSNPQANETKTLPKDPSANITFVSDDKEYVLTDYIGEDGNSNNGYLVVVSEDTKVKIYKKERVTMTQEFFPSNSYQVYKPANYKKGDDEFYVKLGDKEPAFFSGKKEFAKLVGGKNKEVLDFIKKNNIDVEKEADLVKLSAYVETII
ncbi:hypothetical protein FMM05_03670 [Flavobacterium zepuense]|uniref:Uncharacterized protein n=1 Tax=Flavobacterium zepuense TaxID=2593302 RepID=A0A552V7P4_9FLAO|nr:hypothetical protein [Flavobacterium zepuense]TRW26487.1 hypothetical protein FMM05_03670 [Flavobacterium zepuense]